MGEREGYSTIGLCQVSKRTVQSFKYISLDWDTTYHNSSMIERFLNISILPEHKKEKDETPTTQLKCNFTIPDQNSKQLYRL